MFHEWASRGAFSRAAVLSLVCLAGCSSSYVRVNGAVTYPAETPVYCASEIVFIHAPNLPSLVGRLANAVAREGHRTVILTDAEVQARYQARAFGPRVRVVRLIGTLLEEREYVAPATPHGAPGVRRSGHGNVRMVVYDGASGVELAAVPLTATGDSVEEARLVLLTQLTRLLWPHTERVRVALPRLADARVDAALSDLLYGRWSEGRQELERLSDCCRSSPAERAAYFYVLGVARRFDPATLAADPAAHFDAAVEALGRAAELVPNDRRYQHALVDARAHGRAHFFFQQQQLHCGLRPTGG